MSSQSPEEPVVDVAARAADLTKMVHDAEDAGLYDLPADAVCERLPVNDDGTPATD